MNDTLEKDLHTIIQHFPGKVGLYFHDLKTNKTILINADDIFPMASTYKIPILVQFYRDKDAGILSLEDKIILRETNLSSSWGLIKSFSKDSTVTLKDIALMMIAISDNAATDIILEKVTPQRVTQTLESYDLKPMSVNRTTGEIIASIEKPTYDPKADKQDITSPRTMGQLLEKLVQDEIASKQSCQEMKQLLKQQLLNNRIPRKVSHLSHIKIGHKTGTTGWVTNDVGFIEIKDRPEIILCIYTLKNNKSIPTYLAEEVIGDLTARIVQGL